MALSHVPGEKMTWEIEAPTLHEGTTFPKSRHLLVSSTDQRFADVSDKVTSADVIVLDSESLSREGVTKWLNDAYEHVKKIGRQLPTVMVAVKVPKGQIGERERLVREITELGAFLLNQCESENIEDVLKRLEESDKIRLKAFNTTEKDFYYGPYTPNHE